jgi:hypothetical protein
MTKYTESEQDQIEAILNRRSNNGKAQIHIFSRRTQTLDRYI